MSGAKEGESWTGTKDGGPVGRRGEQKEGERGNVERKQRCFLSLVIPATFGGAANAAGDHSAAHSVAAACSKAAAKAAAAKAAAAKATTAHSISHAAAAAAAAIATTHSISAAAASTCRWSKEKMF